MFQLLSQQSRFFSLLGLLGVCCLSPVHADTFLLKDNTQLEGVSVEDGDSYIINTFDGQQRRVKKSEVVGIKRGDEPRNEFLRRSLKLKTDDAAGQYDLGLWAAGQVSLQLQADVQFKRVLKFDPHHEGAGKALKYIKEQDGRWVAPKDPEITIKAGAAENTPTKPRDPGKDREEARDLSQLLDKLKLTDATDAEKNPEIRALVIKAQERPDLFAKVLAAPGKRDGLNIQDGVIRAKTAAVIGLAGDRRGMQPLLDACFEDPDDRVRWAAAKAIPRLDEPIAVRKLVDVAVSGSQPWPIRKLAAIAIRRIADPEGMERLITELSFELAGGNFRDPKNAPRKLTHGPGTENPLGLEIEQLPTTTPDDTIIYPALSAVKEVTGMSFDLSEKDFKTWKQWWRKVEPTFKFKD